MRDTMACRGPDGAGIWTDEAAGITLAFRRLAILDLSPEASQPMHSADGRFCIVYNGEIYNHAEIRRNLISLGVRTWRTDHSDTEVILRSFQLWGIDALERFRGMFAIAIWDKERRELWLVRDRLGVKPLYYSIHSGRFDFASEIKALLTDPAQPRRVNEEALFHYLSFLTAPAPSTMFEGIFKVPPATWLRVGSDGSITTRQFWDVWDHTYPATHLSEQAVAAQIADLLRESVALRKVSDVPVGVLLSGGLDSSANVALFSETAQTPVKTFTIGYRGSHSTYTNETEFARAVAAVAQADYHERLLDSKDAADFLSHMVWLQDEPIADPVCVPIFYVSQLARQNGVVVCQVGEGADELYCGYPAWLRVLRLESYNALPVPRFAKRLGLHALRLAGRKDRWSYEYLKRGVAGLPLFWGGAEGFTGAEKSDLLSGRLKKQFAHRSSWEVIEPLYRRFNSAAWDPSPLNWMTYLDLNMRLPELLLMRVDKMGMGNGVEFRVPYLDHKFVEFAMSIPSTMKTRNGETKSLLKAAMRGIVPDMVIDRPKQGFAVPVFDWLKGSFGKLAALKVRDFCMKTDYLDAAKVDQLILEPRGERLWYLLNLALWWEQFIAPREFSSECRTV